MRGIFENLVALLDRGEDAVLVTIVSAEGSTPRGAGAQLLASREGLIAGSVGGGPGEAQALTLAAALLRERWSQLHRLELRHGGALDSVCGGEQEALFQFLPHDSAAWRTLAGKALERLEAHEKGWLALEAESDPSLLDEGPAGPAWDGRRLVLPLPVGERVVIFDDRPEFANPARFPEAETVVCHDYTDIASGLVLTPEDYAVVMTSGHSHDLEVEKQLLRRPLAYVGVMGSRTKTAYVNQKLRESGIPEEAIQRVHTPIGTAIKAVTPEEIAVSVTGELIYERALRREAAGAVEHGCPSHF